MSTPLPAITKVLSTLFLLIALSAVEATPAAAQCGGSTPSLGDFRSMASDAWNTTDTWETYGGTNWVAASTVPDGTLTTEQTSICDGNNVSVPSSTTVTLGGPLTIEADGGSGGGILSGNNSASTMSFKGSRITNNGAVTVDDFDFTGTSQALEGAGNWEVGDLHVTNGSTTTLSSDVTFKNTTTTIDISGTLALGSNDLTIDAAAANRTLTNNGTVSGSGSVKLQAAPNTITLDADGLAGGSFSSDVEVVDGTTTAASGTMAGGLTIASGATFNVGASAVFTLNGSATNNGTLTGANSASTFAFAGSGFTNGATGSVTVDDFDFTGTSQALEGAGSWQVGDLHVANGSTTTLSNDVTFKNTTTTVDIGGTLALGSNDLTIDAEVANRTLANNGTVSGSGSVKMRAAPNTIMLDADGLAGGSFSSDVEIVDGTTTAASGTMAGGLTIASGATFNVGASAVFTLNGSATNNGTLTGANSASTFAFAGSGFTNGATGSVMVDDFDFTGTSQALEGAGNWQVNDLHVANGSTTTLSSDVTFKNTTTTVDIGGTLALGNNDLTIDAAAANRALTNNGTVSGSGSVKMQAAPNTVTFDADGLAGGSFASDVEVVDGTTTAASGTMAGGLTIASGATFNVGASAVFTLNGSATNNGTLTGANSASTFAFAGSGFTNGATGSVTVDDFDFTGTSQALEGAGSWQVGDLHVANGSTTTLSSDVTFKNTTTTIDGGGTLSPGGNVLTIDGNTGTHAFTNNGTTDDTGTVKTTGTVTFDADGLAGGSFSSDVEVVDGTTTAASGTMAGGLTIASGATFNVNTSAVFTLNGSATNNGTLTGGNSASRFKFSGDTFTNNSAVTVNHVDVGSTNATLQGTTGTWTGTDINILASSKASLGSDITVATTTFLVNVSGKFSTGTSTLSLNGTAFDNNGITGGNGEIDFTGGSFDNNGGIVGPGDSPGIFTFTGPYPRGTSAGRFEIELDHSTTPGTGHDQVVFSGAATLTGGRVDVEITPGYLPLIGDAYTLMTCSDGCSNTLTGGVFLPDGYEADVTYNPNDVMLTLTQVPGADQSADLGVDKVVDQPTAGVGTDVTFTITVLNNGPRDATGIEVTDLLPAGLAFVSATPSAGNYAEGTGIWDGFGLTNGNSATLDIVATVTQTGTITNTATISASDQPDPNASNNSDSAQINGSLVQADLAITKDIDDEAPTVGDVITFTVTATNGGPSEATGITVTDELPTGLTFVSATADAGSYDEGTGLWTIGDLANGTTATLTVEATVEEAGSITNTATITTADQSDPDMENNTASVTLEAMPIDTAIEEEVPTVFSLTQNYPNPFNPVTTIQFSITGGEHVTLTVFDLLGRPQLVLVDEFLAAGEHTVTFEASDLPSGVYLYRLATKAKLLTRTMTLLK